VFGHAPNKASGAQGQLLLQAVSSMNVGGTSANQMTDQLQQHLGLTTLTVESSPQINPENNEIEETTSLVVGKKLSEKLELNYSFGLDKPVNVLRLKYLLSHHWFLQTETSAIENGADIFYTIERD
jgi:translocation and assembly module TamB